MRIRLLLGLGFVAILVVALIVTLGASGLVGASTLYPPVSETPVATIAPPTITGTGTSAAGPGHPDPKAQAPGPAQGGAPSHPAGLPAIRPRITNPALGAPAFTEQDAIDYVLNHGVQGARIITNGPVTVEQVQFLASRDVDARFHTNTGQADAALLCVVTVRGDFTILGPPGGRDKAFSTAIQVFDARTGNLLQQGEAPGAP